MFFTFFTMLQLLYTVAVHVLIHFVIILLTMHVICRGTSAWCNSRQLYSVTQHGICNFICAVSDTHNQGPYQMRPRNCVEHVCLNDSVQVSLIRPHSHTHLFCRVSYPSWVLLVRCSSSQKIRYSHFIKIR